MKTWTDRELEDLIQEAHEFAGWAFDKAALERFFWPTLAEGTGLSIAALKGEVPIANGAELDPEVLLQQATEAEDADRPALVHQLAAAVANQPAIMVDWWADRVKKAGLGTKTAFSETVDQVKQERREQERERQRKAIRRSYAADEAGPLPRIYADNHDLPEITGEAWDALLQANHPPSLFRHGAYACRIERDDDGLPLIRTLTEDRMRHTLARVAYFYVERKQGDELVELPELPPLHVVRDVLATPNMPLPVLSRIVQAPVFAADGTLEIEPGYHSASRTYYTPAEGFTVPAVSPSPSDAEVKRAVELLTVELLGDFPFTGEAEMAHAVAILLQPAIRAMIQGPTPLYLIEKPSPGTGASLLADALTYPALGHPASVMTEGRDDEEWRKRITAKMKTGAQVVLIDNLRRRLDSGALAAAITSPYWEDRVLGGSEIVRVPVTCLWMATGNNPGLSSEMTRRIVRIRLDAKQDRPWIREGFRHDDLRGWAAGHRGELVWACLTLAQAWIAAGRPLHQKPLLGMFESWSRVVGGILQVAGIPGFLTNLDEFYSASDTEGEVQRGFILAWWETLGEKWAKASELFTVAMTIDPPLNLGTGTEKSQQTKLGGQLKTLLDRRFSFPDTSPPLFVKVEKSSKQVQGCQPWRLVKLTYQGDAKDLKDVEGPFSPLPHADEREGGMSPHEKTSPSAKSPVVPGENVLSGPTGPSPDEDPDALRQEVFSLAERHQFPSVILEGDTPMQMPGGERAWRGFCFRSTLNPYWLGEAKKALEALPADLWSYVHDAVADDDDDNPEL